MAFPRVCNYCFNTRFTAQADEFGVPSIGGKYMITISSPSMQGTINEGDLIICNGLSNVHKSNLAVDDIITFRYDINENGTFDEDEFNTHRIVSINYNSDGSVQSYVTQGDNKRTNPGPDSRPTTPDNIVCIYNGSRIGIVGYVLDFIGTQFGFFLVIILPLSAFFIYVLIRFILVLISVTSKQKAISAEEEEAIKQKAIEEYIAKQAAENTKNNDID